MKNNLLEDAVRVIHLLRDHLPDAKQADKCWDWCWDELNDDAQEAVKNARKQANIFLSAYKESKEDENKTLSSEVVHCCKCKKIINAEDVCFSVHNIRGLLCLDCAEQEMPGITSEDDLLED